MRRTSPREQAGSGDEGLGTEGDLAPSPPLTAITYRLGGKLCQRGPSLPPGATQHLAHPCPQPHWPRSRYTPPRDLHQPLNTQFQITHHLVTGVKLSFTAPFAVTGASEDYTMLIPDRCPGTSAYGGPVASLGRNVARGATVTHHFSDTEIFYISCSLGHVTMRSTATIEVLYGRGPGTHVLIGVATVKLPAGTRPAPPPTGRPRRHAG